MDTTARTLRMLALLAIATGLMGCASHILKEEQRGHFTRMNALTVSYEKKTSLSGRYTSVTDANIQAKHLDWSRHIAQKQEDMPVLLMHLENGLNRFLVPALANRNVRVLAEKVDGADGQLRIKPAGFTVECGSLNLICTSKMQVEVSLVDHRQGDALWTAKFSVGKEFGSTQTEEVLQKFYAQMVDRLIQMQAI